MLPGSDDIRVLVVGEDFLTRAGLAALLSDEPGLSVVGQVAGDSSLAGDLDVYRPDVLVWDLGWDPDATEQLAQLRGDPPVVALVSDVSLAPVAWAAGARGVALRDSAAAAVTPIVKAVAGGVIALDPALADSLRPAGDAAPPPVTTGDLTPRELDVLRLLADGLPNKNIALKLGISEHTVKFHINAILGKLSAQSRTEAVSRAIRLGLVPL